MTIDPCFGCVPPPPSLAAAFGTLDLISCNLVLLVFSSQPQLANSLLHIDYLIKIPCSILIINNHILLIGHSYGVNALKFSKFGTLLISASTDGTVILRDAKTGDLLETFFSPTGFGLRTCTLSADSSLIAAGIYIIFSKRPPIIIFFKVQSCFELFPIEFE